MAGFFDDQDVVTALPPPNTKKAGFFDPADVTAPVVQPVMAQPVATSSFFDKEDVASSPAPAPETRGGSTGSTPPDVQPSGLGGFLKQEDLDKIADKHGVDRAQLSEIAPYYTVATPEKQSLLESVGKQSAGTMGRVLGNIPQKIYQQTQSPQMQKAIDELQRTGREQRGFPQELAEAVVLPIPALRGAGLATKLATGAGIGAAFGYGGSESGQETKGTATGAALGLGLSGAAELVGRLGSAASKAEQKVLSRPGNIDLEEISNKAMQERAHSENLLEDAILGRREALSDADRAVLVREQISPEKLTEYLDPTTDAGALIRKSIAPEELSTFGEKAVVNKLADDLVETRAIDFAKKASGDRNISTLEDATTAMQKARRQGEEFLGDEYGAFARGKAADDYVEQHAIHHTNPTGRWGELGYKIADTQFALRPIDEKFGTRAEEALIDLSSNRNRLSYIRANYRKQLDNVFQEAEKTGTVDALKNGRIYDAISSGNLSTLSPEEQKVAQLVKQEFDHVLQFVNEKVREAPGNIRPLSVPKIENYVHNVTVPVPEVVAKVEAEMNNAAELASKRFGRPIDSIAQLTPSEWAQFQEEKPVQNLLQFVNMGTNAKTVNSKSGADLSATLLDKINSRDGRIALDKVARGTMERTGEIPDFIRERNLFRVMDRYTYDMLSNMYQREPLNRLVRIADRLEKVGANTEAQYVRRIAEDTNGVRPGTAGAFMRDLRVELARGLDGKIAAAERAGKTTSARALRTLKEMGDFPQYLARQLYPNVLGWSFRPIMQNMLSGLARTAPELGTKYGYTTYMRGLVYGQLNKKELQPLLREMGLVPEEFIRAGERAMADGIRSNKLLNAGIGATETASKLGMAIYQASEQLNRLSILGTAKMMAHDLAAGSKLAQGSLTNFPTWLQKSVANASNEDEVFRVLSKYLNATTAFNYNRPSLYEFGRTMGPLFATFAKWPTAVLGEALADLRTRGLMRGGARVAERLGPALIGFTLIDQLLSDKLEENGRVTALVGKGGLKHAAPGSSLGAVFTGGVFTPPVIDAIMSSLVIPAADGDVGKLGRGADKLLFSFAPQAGFVKFLTDTVPTFINDSRPEGGTQIEKSVEGVRQLTK